MKKGHKSYYSKKLREADELVRHVLEIDRDDPVYPDALSAVFHKIALPIEDLKIVPK